MRYIFAILTCGVLLFSSCQKDDIPPVDDNAAKTELNVSYGSSTEQKMDIYLPASRSTTSTKVIILIHGGGWTGGDKSDFNAYVDTLKKRLPEYAIFNINYRLATGSSNLFPTQEMDVKAAIEFIYNKRNEYRISDKFVLLGTSAGGHLALLHTYKYTSPVKIKAVVDFFGPTDLTEMYNNPPNPLVPGLLSGIIGGTPTTHATLYQQSSPVTFVSPPSSPTIIFHGSADIVVAPSQSALLQTRLFTAGVINQYVFYPTEAHGWAGVNLTDSFNKIVLFLNANVN